MKKITQTRGCKAFCCSCRFSISSSKEPENPNHNNSNLVHTLSRRSHTMVQEKLDQMIRERHNNRNIRSRHEEDTKFVVMVAMEKSSYNPREDFRESMEQMIVANRIHETKDLRRLLNYYVTMNSDEFRGLILEARAELERGATTVVELLRESMDGVDRSVRRPGLKERLRLKGFGCCGPTWGLGPTTISVRDEEEEEQEEDGDALISPQIEVVDPDPNPIENGSAPPCAAAQSSGMNLAAALAAERQLRAVMDSDNGGPAFPGPSPQRSPTAPATPSRVSLMRLLEETDGYDLEMMMREEGERSDSVCCVCMGRRKGAAFIPCGHTFCRVCSREMWLNRGSCPLCNRSILEILDIY